MKPHLRLIQGGKRDDRPSLAPDALRTFGAMLTMIGAFLDGLDSPAPLGVRPWPVHRPSRKRHRGAHTQRRKRRQGPR